MIINQSELLKKQPIKDMLDHKEKGVLCSHGLTEAGYDITLKQDITFHKDKATGQYFVIVDGSTKPGRFTLASANEYFQMPNGLVGIVHDKSTLARLGLAVQNTVIEPGWKGFLTLELTYHGEEDLHIPAGTGIAQVLFHEIAVTQDYKGKYQNQEDKPVEARTNEPAMYRWSEDTKMFTTLGDDPEYAKYAAEYLKSYAEYKKEKAYIQERYEQLKKKFNLK